MALDLCRENMEEEVVVDQQRPLQIRIRHSGPEHGAPEDAICNALGDSFLHDLKYITNLRYALEKRMAD